MKDIKENQKGLKSLASERPDVVRKMGYDPESFYAGGLAMLAEGGSIDFAALSKALGSMGGDEETIAFNAVMGDAIPAAKASVTRVGGSMDPDNAIEEYKRRQEIEEIEDQKKDEEIAEMFMGGIMDFAKDVGGGIMAGLRAPKDIVDYAKDRVGAVKEYFSPSSPGVQLTEGAEEDMKKIIEDATGKDVGDLTEEEKADILADQPIDKKEKRKATAGKVADGLAALAEGLGGMDGGQMSGGFMGQPIGASQVPITRVGMAEGGIAEGGIQEMSLGGLAGILGKNPDSFIRKVLARKYGEGMFAEGDPLYNIPNDPRTSGIARTLGSGGSRSYAQNRISDSQAQSQKELLSLIDASPLSAADKAVQKQLINLQIGQQTLPLSPQYIASDAPYKALYRPYFSEVTKAYNAARPDMPFSAMAAPPKERVDFNLGMQPSGRMAAPRKVAGVEYAADGMLIDGQFFPERDELVSGPGGEREDKIPAMLSDGEFVVNARTVRGLGMQMGADPMDLEEQKDIGAMVLEYLQDTLGPDGEMAEKIGEEGLGALVRSMA
tara:strand:+ start:3020 stop:4672 length:1653 start_codon:yes stop_codon:yes gene_type:complete